LTRRTDDGGGGIASNVRRRNSLSQPLTYCTNGRRQTVYW